MEDVIAERFPGHDYSEAGASDKPLAKGKHNQRCHFGHTTTSARRGGKETWHTNPCPSFWPGVVPIGHTLCSQCYQIGYRAWARGRPPKIPTYVKHEDDDSVPRPGTSVAECERIRPRDEQSRDYTTGTPGKKQRVTLRADETTTSEPVARDIVIAKSVASTNNTDDSKSSFSELGACVGTVVCEPGSNRGGADPSDSHALSLDRNLPIRTRGAAIDVAMIFQQEACIDVVTTSNPKAFNLQGERDLCYKAKVNDSDTPQDGEQVVVAPGADLINASELHPLSANINQHRGDLVGSAPCCHEQDKDTFDF